MENLILVVVVGVFGFAAKAIFFPSRKKVNKPSITTGGGYTDTTSTPDHTVVDTSVENVK